MISQSSAGSSLSVSPTSYTASLAAMNATATITKSNMGTLYVTSSASWITPSWNVTGSSIKIATSAANGTSTRTGYVYVHGKGEYDGTSRTGTITVRQGSGAPSITLSTGSITGLTPDDHDFEDITITSSNVSSITASTSLTWVSPYVRYGEDLRLVVGENSGPTRYGYVYVHGNGTYGGATTASLYIYQNSGSNTITVTPTSASFTSSGGSTNISVTYTNATAYTVSESLSWITTLKSGNNVTITASANTSTSTRSGYVYFYSTGTYTGTQVYASVYVSQAAAVSTDPYVTIYITNLPELYESIGFSDGFDENLYVCDPADEVTDVLFNYGITTHLYYYDGYLENELCGLRSDWMNFASDYDAVPLVIGFDWDNWIGGEYDSWDGLMDSVRSYTSVDLEWPLSAAVQPSMSAVSTFTSSGGTKYSYASNGTITGVSESLNWITTSYTSTTLTITASSNTSTSSRYGYIYVTVGGQSVSVYVYQSGASVTYKNIQFIVEEVGWMDSNDTELDIDLTAYLSGGTSYSFCNNYNIVNGYGQNGLGDRERSMGSTSFASNTQTYFKVHADVRSTSGGKFKIIDDNTNETLYRESDLYDLESGDSANDISIRIDDRGSTQVIRLILIADSSSGGGTAASGTTSVTTGGWTTATTPISGYKAYQSNSNYNTNNGVATCRVYVAGKAGSFTLYINNHSEAGYDYTVAGKLDTALPTTASSITASTGQGTSKGKTAALASSLSGWTAVTYNIPNTSQHWMDVAYRKDGSVNSGNDRGYLLVPNSW